jgi:ATP/ADP translocase
MATPGPDHRLTNRFCLQDVLVVTAPGSGAEIIPFLKTWVNLPMAIGFTVMYAKVGAE